MSDVTIEIVRHDIDVRILMFSFTKGMEEAQASLTLLFEFLKALVQVDKKNLFSCIHVTMPVFHIVTVRGNRNQKSDNLVTLVHEGISIQCTK